jgi:hypothetical protein
VGGVEAGGWSGAGPAVACQGGVFDWWI